MCGLYRWKQAGVGLDLGLCEGARLGLVGQSRTGHHRCQAHCSWSQVKPDCLDRL